MKTTDKYTHDHRLMHRGCIIGLLWMAISAGAVVGVIYLTIRG